jgi:hypothetical protein
MTDKDRGVPRADHVPEGERKENEERSEHRADLVGEKRADDVDVKPGHAEGGPRGSAGRGGEPSGGSVIDKR